MGVRGAFHLGIFNEWFVAHAQLRVLGIDWLTGPVGFLKHPAIGAIGVVRNGDGLHALCTIGIHPGPQILRIQRIQTSERLRRHVGATENHVAMQVFSSRPGSRVLVADKGGEVTGIVVTAGGFDDFLPGGAGYVAIIQIVW